MTLLSDQLFSTPWLGSRPQEWCLIRSPRDLDCGLYAVMAVMVTSLSVGFWFVIWVRRLLARMSRPR